MHNQLANLLFPLVTTTVQELEQRFKKRECQAGAVVTRFAPSPTGIDLHLGHLFSCLVSSRIAKNSGGTYFLRVEDTDKKREIPGSVEAILSTLKHYGIEFNEGRTFGGLDYGEYGPYLQSQRTDIYHAVAKQLVAEGKAYPCFCSETDLETIRITQANLKCPNLGYYGEFAKCSNLTFEEVEQRINAGQTFVLRFRSPAKAGDRVTYHDAIKGEITLDANINDAVILKSDGVPPYNFAHVCDDHFMRTTLVVRGEEYSGTPTTEHMQLFEACGFECPQYAHNPHIQKLDNGKKRKISKSKDKEASVSFYTRDGYPVQCVLEYLLTLANSNFEQWRAENPSAPNTQFELTFAKLSSSGSLFDLMKLDNVSKNIIATFSAQEVYSLVLEWATVYKPEFAELLKKHKEFSVKMFMIDRGTEKPRKDIAKWSDVPGLYSYFYDEVFFGLTEFDFGNFNWQTIKSVLQTYQNLYNDSDSKEEWFARMKNACDKLNFASDTKAYKENPGNYKGSVADVSTILRVAITGRKNSPDLYQILKLLGIDNIKKRFEYALNNATSKIN